MRIVKIRKAGKKYTWDIEVKNKHHYIMENGVVSHNTISNIAGVYPCVEPAFRNVYVKENLSGSFFVPNKYLTDRLEELSLWDEDMVDEIKLHNGSIQSIERIPLEIRELFKEVFEIDAEWVIRAAAERQKWIDQACSTNIFLKTTSGKVLNDTYMLAWRLGLKTTYYLRTLGASQVTKASLKEKVEEPKVCSILDPDCEACQ